MRTRLAAASRMEANSPSAQLSTASIPPGAPWQDVGISIGIPTTDALICIQIRLLTEPPTARSVRSCAPLALASVLGLVLCIWPQTAMNFICIVAGAALLIGGAWQIIAYLRGKAAAGLAPGSFVSGVFEMLFGLVLVFRPQVVQAAVPLLLSVLLLVDSIVKLQISIDLKRAGYGHWWQSLLASLVIGVAAFIFILDPISSAASIVILIGVAFLVNGVSDLWITLYVSRKIRDLLEK